MNSLEERALASSEIFQEYFKQEQLKIASKKQITEEYAVNEYLKIQDKINNDSKLKTIFATLQKQFMKNPSGADPEFINAVLSLNVEE